MESRLHFGERKIQPAEVMPGAVFGEMFDGLLQKSTRISALLREQTRHAAIEENGNGFGLCLPGSQRLLGLAAMPREGGSFVFPSRTPIRGRLQFIDERLGSIIVSCKTQDRDGDKAFRKLPALDSLAGPFHEFPRSCEWRIGRLQRMKLVRM